jgi:thiamine-phosphate pyrophosphorylase
VKGLYPIVDLDALARAGLAPLAFAERVLAARPALIQLRAKQESSRSTLALLDALKPLCLRAGTLLFANDRADLALLAGADGVHLGQDDLPLDLVRRFAPSLKVGVSTHDLAQLERALAERPDYVAFGPVFPTSSKQRPDAVVGLSGLSQAASRARSAGIPLVAIGGITLAHSPAIAELGALAAVIGALVTRSLDDSEREAKALQRALTSSA